jgi:serine/threonine protein kinase
VTHASSLFVGKDLCPGYRLRRLRGQGGFGSVWEAETQDGDVIAVKILKCDDDTSAAKEIQAIQLITQLRHRHLTPIHKVWAQRGYVVISMPVAEGSLLDLYEACQNEFHTPMDPTEVLPLLDQVASALDFLNKRQHLFDGARVGIQHCDVKPSNILLFGNDVKLCDFGLSSQTSSSLKPHRRAGTLDYAAPEVFQGRLSDATDQYALAVTYCQLRGGRFPFADTPDQFRRDYVRPDPDLTMLDAAERPVIARSLSHVPQQRWATCKELIAQLRRCH